MVNPCKIVKSFERNLKFKKRIFTGTPQGLAHRRKTPRLCHLRQTLPDAIRATGPRQIPPAGRAEEPSPVRPVSEEVRHETQPLGTQKDPRRREGVHVRPVRKKLRAEGQPRQPFADAHSSETVRLYDVRESVQNAG